MDPIAWEAIKLSVGGAGLLLALRTYFMSNRKNMLDRLEALERHVEECQTKLDARDRQLDDCRDEKIHLMQRLLVVTGRASPST